MSEIVLGHCLLMLVKLPKVDNWLEGNVTESKKIATTFIKLSTIPTATGKMFMAIAQQPFLEDAPSLIGTTRIQEWDSVTKSPQRVVHIIRF